MRLYRRIGGMQAGQGYIQRIGGRSTEERYSTACIYSSLKPTYSTPSISLSLQSIDTSNITILGTSERWGGQRFAIFAGFAGKSLAIQLHDITSCYPIDQF